MVMVCKQVFLGYEDDYGNKEYETVCEDDGTENPDTTTQDPNENFIPSWENRTVADTPFDYNEFIRTHPDFADGIASSGLTDAEKATIAELKKDPSVFDKILKQGRAVFVNSDGTLNWAALATTGLAVKNMISGQGSSAGYNKAVPVVDATRAQLQYDDPNRAPGSGGRQYFTDTQYSKTGDPVASAAAKTATEGQAAGILGAYRPVAAPAVNPWAGKMKTSWNSAPVAAKTNAANTTAASENQTDYNKTFEGIQQLLGGTGSQGIPDEYKKYVNVDDTGVAAPGTSIGDFSGTTDKRQRQGPGSIVDEGFSKVYNPQTPEEIAAGQRVSPAYLDEKIAANSQTAKSQAGDMQKMADSMQRQYAQGGLMAAHGRYLQGGTDGMADKIPSSIDGDQPAALSHGEFVIPADVVSHLGNGNSDAGAEKLYQMMARIRKARTGNSDQGKKINPDKFMPGGLANSSYATGGNVQHFDTGGIPLDVSTSKGLAPWAGDYVTNMLGEGAALAKAPMQVYGGPLTAGASNLQQQGFAGISDVAQAGYDPAKFTSGTFDTAAATKYMNPYLQASLNPQLAEARRQSEITQLGNAGRATQAGAFGGGRQAIMDAESQRSLGANLANITGTGYNTAYDKAQQQFNTEQGRSMDAQTAEEASRKYSADYGLKSLSDLMAAGATERGIAAEGIAADKKQFEEQAAHPFNMVEFQRKLVEGLPIGSSTVSTNPDDISKIKSDIAGLAAMYQTLSNLGIKTAN
jgi:hypothetical protein